MCHTLASLICAGHVKFHLLFLLIFDNPSMNFTKPKSNIRKPSGTWNSMSGSGSQRFPRQSRLPQQPSSFETPIANQAMGFTAINTFGRFAPAIHENRDDANLQRANFNRKRRGSQVDSEANDPSVSSGFQALTSSSHPSDSTNYQLKNRRHGDAARDDDRDHYLSMQDDDISYFEPNSFDFSGAPKSVSLLASSVMI